MIKPIFKNIPQLTKSSNYRVNITWKYLAQQMAIFQDEMNLDIDPDFQRDHVWTLDQQIKYIEYVLRGGTTGLDIYFNCIDWACMKSDSVFVLIDGKQRLNAVRKFMNNELKAFGYLFKEFEDSIRMRMPQLIFNVNDLETRKDVLQWYLEINTAGTPHTVEEIEKVENMLKKEQK